MTHEGEEMCGIGITTNPNELCARANACAVVLLITPLDSRQTPSRTYGISGGSLLLQQCSKANMTLSRVPGRKVSFQRALRKRQETPLPDMEKTLQLPKIYQKTLCRTKPLQLLYFMLLKGFLFRNTVTAHHQHQTDAQTRYFLTPKRGSSACQTRKA